VNKISNLIRAPARSGKVRLQEPNSCAAVAVHGKRDTQKLNFATSFLSSRLTGLPAIFEKPYGGASHAAPFKSQYPKQFGKATLTRAFGVSCRIAPDTDL